MEGPAICEWLDDLLNDTVNKAIRWWVWWSTTLLWWERSISKYWPSYDQILFLIVNTCQQKEAEAKWKPNTTGWKEINIIYCRDGKCYRLGHRVAVKSKRRQSFSSSSSFRWKGWGCDVQLCDTADRLGRYRCVKMIFERETYLHDSDASQSGSQNPIRVTNTIGKWVQKPLHTPLCTKLHYTRLPSVKLCPTNTYIYIYPHRL